MCTVCVYLFTRKIQNGYIDVLAVVQVVLMLPAPVETVVDEKGNTVRDLTPQLQLDTQSKPKQRWESKSSRRQHQTSKYSETQTLRSQRLRVMKRKQREGETKHTMQDKEAIFYTRKSILQKHLEHIYLTRGSVSCGSVDGTRSGTVKLSWATLWSLESRGALSRTGLRPAQKRSSLLARSARAACSMMSASGISWINSVLKYIKLIISTVSMRYLLFRLRTPIRLKAWLSFALLTCLIK